MDNQIDCFSFENRIQELMDQRVELGSDQLIQEHAQHCTQCKQVLSSFESLESAFLFAFAEPLEAETFASGQSINRPPAIRTQDRQNEMASWGIASAIMAIAATLLVVIPPLFESTPSISIAKNESVSIIDPSVTPNADIAPQFAGDKQNAENPPINLVVYETLPSSLRNAYQYAAELPGIRPIECSLNATLDVLQKSLGPIPTPQTEETDPDLGTFLYASRNKWV